MRTALDTVLAQEKTGEDFLFDEQVTMRPARRCP